MRFPATNAGLTKGLLVLLTDVQNIFCLGILVKVFGQRSEQLWERKALRNVPGRGATGDRFLINIFQPLLQFLLLMQGCFAPGPQLRMVRRKGYFSPTVSLMSCAILNGQQTRDQLVLGAGCLCWKPRSAQGLHWVNVYSQVQGMKGDHWLVLGFSGCGKEGESRQAATGWIEARLNSYTRPISKSAQYADG